jgi:hypothetical protein
MAELIISISPSGETSLEVMGASGPGCRKYTQGLEEALGTVAKSRRKPEYDCDEQSCTNTLA